MKLSELLAAPASDLKANDYQQQRKAAREEAAKSKTKETYDQALQRHRQQVELGRK